MFLQYTYIYGGGVNFENLETKIIYELMIVANELEFKELSEKLESYLIESKASWLNFTSLQEAALISILEKDNLQLEEIKIWDYVIKWGIAQNPKNFKTLKVSLQQCLPLIRYFHISEKDVWEKLKPYRKILGTQLWDDLQQHRIFPNQPVKSLVLSARIISNPELPQRVNELISTIISEEHVAEISTWIDRKSTNYSLTNVPYKLQLILRGSKDGFQPKTFWNMCNGHAGTVVIVKVAGYNPLAWDNSKTYNVSMETNDSFIFSLKNGNIQNSILSRVKYKDRALFYCNFNDHKRYGPYFGNSEFSLESGVSDFTKDKICWCTYAAIARQRGRSIGSSNSA
ncbi:hypothetical protein Glove_109g14 [Diversispora epigaea]|uniref:TLDc domain-containing protein n=1 Tax=Diversispora epigaea TaxID=1348612 RepID=A0A397J265_9GLOM|nr:hypothetical protein Glove_109g14 [Diversispora epigaea]